MAYQSRLELSIDSRSGERNLKRFEGQLDRTERAGAGLVGTMGGIARIVSLASAAVGGFTIGRVITETAAFEDSMLGLQAVSQATAEQMRQLEEQARTLGATSMFSAQQAGDAQRFLAQAGFEVNEVLSATPGILQLATAGQMGLAQAADIASNVLGGMRLEVEELSRVNDVLAATAAGSNTTVSQLGQALSTAAPLAAAAGISIEETAASIGVLSDAGIQAERAGTGLQGVIRQLSNVTPQAQSALESYGLSVEQVNVETNGLSAVLERLQVANISTADAFRIFGSEAGAAAQILINGNGRVSEFTDSLGDAEGEAERMALTIGSGITGSIRGFNSMLSESVIQLGDSGLAGAFESVTDSATGVLAVYNDMLPDFAEANDLTEEQVDRIEMLAGGFDLLGDAALLAGGILGARFAGQMAAGTVSVYDRIKANTAHLNAEAAAAAASARRTAAEKQTALALLSTTRLEEQATRGTAAHTYALQQLSVARTRATTAAGAHTAAMNTATAAIARASVAARGLSGAMALVGGPLGLLVGAGGLMYAFREELGLVRSAAEPTTERIDNLTDALNRNSVAAVEAGIVNMASEYFTLGQSAAAARAEIEQLNAAQQDDTRGARQNLQNNMRLRDLGEELAQITTEQEAAGDAANELREVLAGIGETSVDATNSLTDLSSSSTDLSKAQKEAQRQADQFADSLRSLEEQLFPLEAAQRQYRGEQMLLQTALMNGTIGIERYVDAWQRLQDAQRSDENWQEAYGFTGNAANEVDKLSDSASDLGMTFESAFENAIVNGEGFRDVLDGIYQDILRIAVRKGISEPVGNAIAGAFGSYFGGNAIEGGFTSQIQTGPGYSGGGYTGPGAKMDPAGIVHAGEFVVKKSVVDNPGVRPFLENLNRKGYAEGGYVGGGSAASPSAPPVNVYISTPQGTEARTEERQNAQGGRDLHVIIDEVTAQNMNNPGSRTGRAMQQRFGAQRTLTGR